MSHCVPRAVVLRDTTLDTLSRLKGNPPDIENGFIYKAYPVKITSNYYMLAKPDSTDDPRVLVRIKTRWIYTRKSYGEWETLAGTPQNLMVGSGVHGLIARSKAQWYEGLVLLAPGDAVCITPEGANEVERYVLLCPESGIHHISFSDYRSQIANKREAVYI